MLFKNILIPSALAFASVAYADPTVLQECADIEVFTNRNTSMVTSLDTATVTAGLTATKRQVTFAADAIVVSIIDKLCSRPGHDYSDTNRRMSFTKQVVSSAANQFPGKNVVMSNVGYTFTGATITTQWAVYKARVRANVDFDVLVFDNGHTFTLNGDGGFRNWAIYHQPVLHGQR